MKKRINKVITFIRGRISASYRKKIVQVCRFSKVDRLSILKKLNQKEQKTDL